MPASWPRHFPSLKSQPASSARVSFPTSVPSPLIAARKDISLTFRCTYLVRSNEDLSFIGSVEALHDVLSLLPCSRATEHDLLNCFDALCQRLSGTTGSRFLDDVLPRCCQNLVPDLGLGSASARLELWCLPGPAASRSPLEKERWFGRHCCFKPIVCLDSRAFLARFEWRSSGGWELSVCSHCGVLGVCVAQASRGPRDRVVSLVVITRGFRNVLATCALFLDVSGRDPRPSV